MVRFRRPGKRTDFFATANRRPAAATPSVSWSLGPGRGRRACDPDLVLDPDSSAIVLAGRDVRDLPTVRDGLAFEGAHIEGDDL